MRRAVSVLVLVSAVWFGWFAFENFLFAFSSGPVNRQMFPVGSEQTHLVIAILNVAEVVVALGLAIFIWRGSLIAVAIAAAGAFVSLPLDLVFPALFIPLPQIAVLTPPAFPLVLTVPILILCVIVLIRARPGTPRRGGQGLKRRRAIAMLLFVEIAALLFQALFAVSDYQDSVDNPTFAGGLEAVWLDIAGTAFVVVLGLFVWRGARLPIFVAGLLALGSVGVDLFYAIVWLKTDAIGAIEAALFFPFLIALPGALAVPIAVLAATMIAVKPSPTSVPASP